MIIWSLSLSKDGHFTNKWNKNIKGQTGELGGSPGKMVFVLCVRICARAQFTKALSK